MTHRATADHDHNNFTLLRVLLALMVVLGHSKLLSGIGEPEFPFNLADAAVDSFFIVSGYLITASYHRGYALEAFYVRRIFRLYPMYLLVVLAQTAVILSLLPGGPFSEPRATLRYVIANAVLANFLQYDIGGVLAGLHDPSINPSLWTLKVEIGFYLIVPPLYAAVRRWGWPILMVLFLSSATYAFLLRHHGDARLARQLPGQMQFFVSGMALYLYGKHIKVNPWISAAIVIAFPAIWTLAHPVPDGIRPVVVAAFVYSFALCTRPVRLSADLSYSVYLLHGPIIQTLILLGLFHPTLPWIAAVGVTVIAISFVTERLIERPGTELGRALSSRLARRPVIAVTST